jgi:hypothetical protein
MSNYENFTKGYAVRCAQLLEPNGKAGAKEEAKSIYQKAIDEKIEVTLLLCVASSGVMIPFDRLDKANHVSGNAVDKDLSGAVKDFATLLDKTFKETDFWPKVSSDWCYGKLDLEPGKSTLQGTPDDWIKKLTTEFGDLSVRQVVGMIRNGLAHGNVFQTNHNPIKTLMLLSHKYAKEKADCECGGKKNQVVAYHCISLSPNSLREFVRHWFAELEKLEIPNGVR